MCCHVSELKEILQTSWNSLASRFTMSLSTNFTLSAVRNVSGYVILKDMYYFWYKKSNQSSACNIIKRKVQVSLPTARLSLVPRIKNHLSSFNLVFWTFFRAKICCVVCHSYYSATKPHSIRLLRRFDFSQSENRKKRKTFQGASVEATI